MTTTVTSPSAASFALCREITRTQAGNFYHGLKLMAEPKKSAMFAVYAWMRRADDLADEEATDAASRAAKEENLRAFWEKTEKACMGGLGDEESEIWPAVQATFVKHRVPKEPLWDMIQGQLRDQNTTSYASTAELESYCYQVASTVGLVCLAVWGYEGGPATEKLAVRRGIALQWTNILRDVVEDARRDRLYLPADELARFGMDPRVVLASLKQGQAPAGDFAGFMKSQIAYARQAYADARGLETHLEPDSRGTCWALGEIYRQLLEKIAQDPMQVLHGRVSVPKWKKLMIGLRAKMGTPWK